MNITKTSWISSTSVIGNETDETVNANEGGCGAVHDIELDKTVRLLILYLTIIIGLIGALLVLSWMAFNRRVSPRFNHLSQVNSFILNLTLADTLVILLAVLPQLIWEYVDREWTVGPVMCKVIKFNQSFSMMASNYILVVIALDRHQAIRAPLKESMPASFSLNAQVWQMTGIGWSLAALLSLPMFGVFQVNTVDGMTKCENIFRGKPMLHRQIWMTYVYAVVFVVPFFILGVCYTRIFLKVAQKTNEHANRKTMRFKTGKIHFQSTQSTSLPKAKIKTLKLTFAIICVFTVCSLPYFVVEMIMSYGDHCIISNTLYAILGGMAASNSAANPFVFLAFSINAAWLSDLKKRTFAARKKPRYIYSATSSMDSHFSGKAFGNVTQMSHLNAS